MFFLLRKQVNIVAGVRVAGVSMARWYCEKLIVRRWNFGCY